MAEFIGLDKVQRSAARLDRKARKLDKEAPSKLADKAADRAKRKSKKSKQSAIVGATVKATSAAVIAGGNARIGRNQVPAYKVLFGSEFGSANLKQFPPPSKSYWFFTAVEAIDTGFLAAELIAEWRGHGE